MVTLDAIPFPLEWHPEPASWKAESGVLSVEAAQETDLFVDPFGGKGVTNAPKLLFEPQGDFSLRAHVRVNFSGTFDAGALVVFQDDMSWGKLCLEFSPQREPMIVSVVTKGSSDDCNSVVLDGTGVHLRCVRIGQGFAMHYSLDGLYWRLVRAFALPEGPVRAGFLAQAPRGAGCHVQFSAITLERSTPGDLRSGE